MKYILIIILPLLIYSCNEQAKSDSFQKHEYPTVGVISNYKLPYKMDFCGEKVPLEIPEVRERAEREFYLLLQQPGQIMLYLKRAGKYFPTFEKIIRENGMPDDIKYLSVAESALYMSRSPVGAVGLWQFMPETARAYGLIVDDYIDERKHVEKSTIAAMKYLKEGKSSSGSWLLSAAGYNMGPGRVVENINFQLGSNYFDLYLNEETSRYIFRIVCIKEIMKNPKKYGFELEQNDIYKPDQVKYVKVQNSISNLTDFASSQGTTYKDVKLLNPWILKRELKHPSKGKFYEIAIPN